MIMMPYNCSSHRCSSQATQTSGTPHGQRATSVKFLIRDHAGQFTSSFDAVFAAEGIRILASPP